MAHVGIRIGLSFGSELQSLQKQSCHIISDDNVKVLICHHLKTKFII